MAESCQIVTDTLVRLPLFYELTDWEIDKIVKLIIEFTNK